MSIKRSDLKKAEKLVAQGKLQDAIDKYKKILRDEPTDTNLLNAIGDLYVRIGETKLAVPHFQKAAESLENSGFRTKSIAVLRKAYRQAPSNSEIVETLATLLQQEGLTADARAILLELAQNRQQLGKYRDALSLYKKVLEIDPNHMPSLLKIGEIAAKEGNVNEECDAYVAIAEHLAKSARYEEALEIIEAAFKSAPQHKELVKVYGDLLHKIGNVKKSEYILSELYDNHSDDPDVIVALGELAIEANNLNKAQEYFNSARALTPDSERVIFLGSAIALKNNEPEIALDYLNPLVEEVLSNSQGGPVIAALEEIHKRNPNHLATLNKLKSIYTYLKDSSDLIRILLALSKAHEEANDFSLAIEAMKQVQDMEPDKLAHKSRLEKLYSSSKGAAMFGKDAAPEPQDLPDSLEIEIEDEPEESKVREVKVDPTVNRYLLESDVFLRYGLTQKARERLKEAEKIDAHEPLIQERLSNVFVEEKDIASAIEALESAKNYWAKMKLENEVERVSQQIELLKSGEKDKKEFSLSESSQGSSAATTEAIEATVIEVPEDSSEIPQPEDPLENTISEARYYIEQNFISAARHLLVTLKDQHPDHPEINEMLETLSVHDKKVADVSDVEKEIEDFFSPLEGDKDKPVRVVEIKPNSIDSSAAEASVAKTQQSDDNSDELIREIAETLEEELFAVHNAAEKRLEEIGVSKQLVHAERILSHVSGEFSSPSQEDAGKHLEMGQAYLETGLYEEAINEFQLASEDPVHFQKACLQLGICFLGKGMDSVAINWLQKGIGGGGDETIMADSLHQLAIIYQVQSQQEAFEHTITQLDALAPDHPGLATLKELL